MLPDRRLSTTGLRNKRLPTTCPPKCKLLCSFRAVTPLRNRPVRLLGAQFIAVVAKRSHSPLPPRSALRLRTPWFSRRETSKACKNDGGAQPFPSSQSTETISSNDQCRTSTTPVYGRDQIATTACMAQQLTGYRLPAETSTPLLMAVVQRRPRLRTNARQTKRTTNAWAKINISEPSSSRNVETISWTAAQHLKCRRPRL